METLPNREILGTKSELTNNLLMKTVEREVVSNVAPVGVEADCLRWQTVRHILWAHAHPTYNRWVVREVQRSN